MAPWVPSRVLPLHRSEALPWFGGFGFMLQPLGLMNGNVQLVENAASVRTFCPFEDQQRHRQLSFPQRLALQRREWVGN